ncbi:MAG: WXG100 family type VII secretion target [Lachnospiraceae bacterium]|nr:WXG100 family type VII secretion target [Lachnospiraceae bacterium]
MAIKATLVAPVETIKSSSTRFGNLATQVNNLMKKMMTLIQNSKSVWQGEANDAYLKKFNDLQADMTKIFKKIDEYRTDLTTIAKNYESAETTNKSAANALKSNIIK